jgi:hypothetical protein
MHTISLGILVLLTGFQTARTSEAKPAPNWDAKFQQTDGWIGGDGAYSVAITPERTVWLFSDSFVGKVREGKRTEATMVNNAVGVQEGHGESSRFRFVVGKNKEGNPAAIVVPPDGRGWFWIADGVCIEGKLYLFLPQIEKKAGDEGAFGFQQVAQWLATVANPLDDPTEWRVEYQKLPFSEFSEKRSILFGCAVLRVDQNVYIYGIDELSVKPFPNKRMVLARVKAESLADPSSWRFFHDGQWISDFQNATPLASGMANEASVSYQSEAKRYLAVYTELGLSDRIVARTAKEPWGPWSEPVLLFTCPEMKKDKNLFCYAAKAHATEPSGGDLLVSYIVNSFDFWQVARDASLYWPRCVRVKCP